MLDLLEEKFLLASFCLRLFEETEANRKTFRSNMRLILALVLFCFVCCAWGDNGKSTILPNIRGGRKKSGLASEPLAVDPD